MTNLDSLHSCAWYIHLRALWATTDIVYFSLGQSVFRAKVMQIGAR